METAIRSSDVACRRASDLSLINELSTAAVESLDRLGYAHITEPVTLEVFEAIAERLGSIAMRTDLTITPGRSSIVYKADAIAFHQDNPAMKIIGWHCVQQDDLDGSARLVDTSDIVDRFTSDELDTMSGISVRCPESDPNRHNPDKGLIAYFLWPMVMKSSNRWLVYYVPWLTLDSYTPEQKQAIEKFDEYLREKEVINIRLQEGETLFIDNNRMLHGREAIQAGSKRFLKRVWIRRE
jgi:hypothetical protein